MAYSSVEAREQMLGDIAEAAGELSRALACFTEAYEVLDDDGADALEAGVFRPVQSAYGRLKRTYAGFAGRHGLSERPFVEASAGPHSADPRVYLERGVQAAEDAEQRLAELQDSMMPVEVGDPELRAGLAETRTLLADVPAHGNRLLRNVGR